MNLPKRKNIRLKDYDYSKDNAYFITICTHNRKNLFVRSTISKAVGYLKMNASRDIHNKGYTDTVWQRSFYDHVIRSEQDYQKIRNYIDTNPAKWQEDKYYK